MWSLVSVVLTDDQISQNLATKFLFLFLAREKITWAIPASLLWQFDVRLTGKVTRYTLFGNSGVSCLINLTGSTSCSLIREKMQWKVTVETRRILILKLSTVFQFRIAVQCTKKKIGKKKVAFLSQTTEPDTCHLLLYVRALRLSHATAIFSRILDDFFGEKKSVFGTNTTPEFQLIRA